MRPLIHPAIQDVPIGAILHALSDPLRLTIYADIVGRERSQNCSAFLQVQDKAIPKSTLSQHIKVLREAGLIRSERRGVESFNLSRSVEVDAHYPLLIATILQAHNTQLATDAAKTKKAKRKR